MHLIGQLLALLGLSGRLALGQYRTEPFRTYGLLQFATVWFPGSLAAAAAARRFGLALLPPGDSRLYVPALALLLTVLATGLQGLRLLVHRSLNLRSLRRAVAPAVLSDLTGLLFGRAFPRTLLPVFLVLAGLGWFASGPAGALIPTTLLSLWAMVAVTTFLCWWTLGEEREALEGSILWPASRRPLRFVTPYYDADGPSSQATMIRLLELPEREFGPLLEPGLGGPEPGEQARRELLRQLLTSLTARLASVVPPDRLPEVVRSPLPALGGGSLLALLRRALDRKDPLTVTDFYLRVARLTQRDLTAAPAPDGDEPNSR